MRRTIMLAAVAAASVTGATEEYDLPDGFTRTSGNSESPAPTTGFASRMVQRVGNVKDKLFGAKKEKPDHEQETTDTQGEAKTQESFGERTEHDNNPITDPQQGNLGAQAKSDEVDDPTPGGSGTEIGEKPHEKIDPTKTSGDEPAAVAHGEDTGRTSGGSGTESSPPIEHPTTDHTAHVSGEHDTYLKPTETHGQQIWDDISSVPSHCCTSRMWTPACGGEDHQLLNDDQCGLATVLGTCGLAYLLSFFCRGKGKKSVRSAKAEDAAQSTGGGSDGGEVAQIEVVPEIDDPEEVSEIAAAKDQSSAQSGAPAPKEDRKSGAFVKICASIAVLGLVAGTVYYFFFTGESEEDEEEDEEEQSSEGDE